MARPGAAGVPGCGRQPEPPPHRARGDRAAAAAPGRPVGPGPAAAGAGGRRPGAAARGPAAAPAAPALWRAGGPRGAGARHRPAAPPADPGRAHQRARCVGADGPAAAAGQLAPGTGCEPAVRVARSGGGAPAVPAGGGDAARPHRRERHHRAGDGVAAPPLHGTADGGLGRAGRRRLTPIPVRAVPPPDPSKAASAYLNCVVRKRVCSFYANGTALTHDSALGHSSVSTVIQTNTLLRTQQCLLALSFPPPSWP